MLKELKQNGKILALATAKPEQFAKTVIDYFDISQFLDCVAGTTMENKDHNKANIINNVLEELNADKNEAIMVGDRKFDITAAKECNIKSIGVKYGYALENELEEFGADFVVDTTDELKKLLLKS